MVYNRVEDVDFTLTSLPEVPMPKKVLMTSPKFFEVEYVINPHMRGQIGSIDAEIASQQWHALKEVYQQIGVQSFILEGIRGFPDMVFCANQTLPFNLPNVDKLGVILSNMYATQRAGEVRHAGNFFRRQGYTIKSILSEPVLDFEGMGDAIWHPNLHLLWGGYGYRTNVEVYKKIAQLLDVKIITLELSDADFYHLDTCFSVLNSKTVMIYPHAFTRKGLNLIYHFFEQVIECPENESRNLFACNAHCPDQKRVIIQRGCSKTVGMLEASGFIPIEVDTSEYLKSGGSVFCMKQMFW